MWMWEQKTRKQNRVTPIRVCVCFLSFFPSFPCLSMLRECLLCVYNQPLSRLPLLRLSLCVLYFKYTPGVYLTAIQSNPIFQNLEKHIFSFYCLFVCGAFASHMCVCSSVKRSGPKSKVEYNNSLCLTKLYGKASNLHLFTAFFSNSRTLAHMSWPQNKKEPWIRTSRLGEKLKKNCGCTSVCDYFFFFLF